MDENVRFNFRNNIEVGDDVLINRGAFIDSKGGVRIGDGSGIAEFVVIFTHSHSESDHAERIYSPVVIGDYAKIYTEAMILPGVTIHREAIVAAKSIVSMPTMRLPSFFLTRRFLSSTLCHRGIP